MSAQTKIAFAEQAVEKYDEMMRSSEPISVPQEVISELMRQTFLQKGGKGKYSSVAGIIWIL